MAGFESYERKEALIRKYDDRVGETRSHLLPILDVNVLAARTLQDVNLNFPAGMFGSFPSIGPFPPTASRLTAPAQWGNIRDGRSEPAFEPALSCKSGHSGTTTRSGRSRGKARSEE